MSFTCPTCGTEKGCLSGYSLELSPQHKNTIDALAASEQRNRELTERLDAAERVVVAAMDLKNGLHWDESCAGTIKFPKLVEALVAYYLIPAAPVKPVAGEERTT